MWHFFTAQIPSKIIITHLIIHFSIYFLLAKKNINNKTITLFFDIPLSSEKYVQKHFLLYFIDKASVKCLVLGLFLQLN